jgi:hypothetical protein
MRQVKKQQEAMEGKSLNELTTKLFEDAKDIGRQFLAVLQHVVDASDARSNGSSTSDSSRHKRDTSSASSKGTRTITF